ncbi:NAD(P)H-dependent oxidoreductase [Amorphus sp. 3PC139-8]|uniref:NAD(P)H-dependent oxidoreductase n=1 Tax=Amorphus sp. 3PC139-8 TaxID=2735676 RepID=UPI00345DDF3E
MHTGKIIGFCGSSWRPAKPRALVAAVGETLENRYGLSVELVDLVDAGPGLGAYRRDDLDDPARAVLEDLEGADGLVIGCPVFQGSYPGLFKHVFDLVHPSALRNTPVLLTAVGGGMRHSLVVEHQLRPLFGFFEAATVSTAIYASAEEFVEGRPVGSMLEARLANAAEQFVSLVHRRSAAAQSGVREPANFGEIS